MKKIRVKLKQHGYDVVIGRGLLRQAGIKVKALLPRRESRVFVVTSPTVLRHWGEALEDSFQQANLQYHMLEMVDGEPAKRLATVEKLAEQIVEAGGDRAALVIALGGGVVGDCAGFLASIFMRGIPVVQIPTTVLAQVDASIGGKTGVNLRAGKNLVGSFHQPRAVLVDPEVLNTLNEREFRSGLFEVLKCGIIRDAKLFAFMERNVGKIRARDRKALEWIIPAAVQIKARVVASDEKEAGLRRILNFGHTIGHALESATGYSHFLHGEAVAWGMIAASAIARDAGVCVTPTAERIQAAVRSYGPLPAVTVSTEEVVSRLSADKKTMVGAVHFVLPERIGKVKVATNIPTEIVHRAVDEIRNQ